MALLLLCLCLCRLLSVVLFPAFNMAGGGGAEDGSRP